MFRLCELPIMRSSFQFYGLIALIALLGCGSSSNNNTSPSGADSGVDPAVHQRIREAVEAYLAADDMSGEEALFARVDDEWKDVPFSEFEGIVRDRPPIELTAGITSAEWTVGGTKTGKYFLYVPANLAGLQKALPLVVFLQPGAGDGESVARYGGIQAVVDELGAMLVAPNCDTQCDWSANETCARQVVTVVQHLERVLPVDPDRVILTGFSMGGRGSFSVGAAYPGAFAGVVPAAGSIGAIRGSRNLNDHKPDVCPHTENFASTRLWFFTGANDLPELLAQNRGAASCLSDQGNATFHFETIPEIGHEFRPSDWKPAMQWALEKPRERFPARTVYHLAPQLSGEIDNGVWFQNKLRWTPYWAFFLDRKDETVEARIEATHDGQEITVKTQNVAQAAIYLPAEWLREQPIRVTIDGQLAFEDKVKPDVHVLLHEAHERSDRSMTFAAKLELPVP